MSIINWNSTPNNFFDAEHSSQRNVLHPLTAGLVNSWAPAKLLDYGCGDGRLLELLNKNIEVSVFDQSFEVLNAIKEKRGTLINTIYLNRNDIPNNHFDMIVLSMVLMCIDDKEEYQEVCNKIGEAVKPNGKVIITLSHPCFRQHKFSNFYASYSEQQPFNYLAEGEPFVVTLNEGESRQVSFEDYHYPLSFTLNALSIAGLMVEKMIETSDDKSQPSANLLYSPYLIFICKRYEK